MELKSSSGKYLMPDDPVFDPIFEVIQAHDRTLYAHLAEPSAAWRPLTLQVRTIAIIGATLTGTKKPSLRRVTTSSNVIPNCAWWFAILAAWKRTLTKSHSGLTYVRISPWTQQPAYQT
jgi:hypothetical protein